MIRKYPLSKEELSLYLACTLNPDRKNAYLVGWSVELPADTDRDRIKKAVRQVFDRHRILNARIECDEKGRYWKYDSEEEIMIELETSENESPAPEDYYIDMKLDGGKMYRVVIVDTPISVDLFIIVHHLVMDGTGRQVFVRDFEKAFKGEDTGEPDFAPFEFAIREQENEKDPAFEEDRKYYKDFLSGVECLFPEPDADAEIESFDQFFYPFARIKDADVKNKKGSAGVRTSTIFLGAVGYALAVFAGSDQSVLASAMSGRTEEIKNSCGMFVRTLPMLSNIRPDRSVDEYLKELDEQTTAHRNHSLYTYMDLSHELDLSLKISFAYQGDMISDKVMFDGEERRMGFLRANESDYEMRLYLWRKNGEYLFEAIYRSDHYTREFMDSFSAECEQVLLEMLNKDRLSDIELVSEEQKAILDGFNRTGHEYEKCDIVTLFRRQVKALPGNTAVIFGDKKLTYSQVDEITERLGSCLKTKGIGTEDVVSVLIPRSELIVLISLGILKAGAAYQPLDPSYPPERLGFMIEDAAAKLLIADRSLMDCVPDYKGELLFTDEIDALPETEGLTDTPKSGDRFIMLYTSGTTGVPKGVMLEHGNLTAFCAWYRDYYSLTPDSRVAAYASYGFDANMMDLYPALTTGAAVVIVPEEIRLDFSAIKQYFDEHQVTHSLMTTQVGRQFAQYYEGGSLKHLSVGGEKLTPLYPGKSFAFHNAYGPTECTIISTIFKVDRLYKRVPIGKPLYNLRLYVVDTEGRRLPVGAPGEMWVAGPQVGRGYLNRPEKDAEVFVRNIFDAEEGYEKAYRTGDVVRMLPDGNVDFVGRNDGQVKIRGFRIELPEVEAVIREFPGIKDATVQAFDDEGGGKFIAAYIVSDKEIDVALLNDFIRSKKPPYMVPASTMQIDSIPLNQNQKVNKRALPQPVFDTQSEAEENRTRTLLEEQIISCIQEVVGDLEIGVSGSLVNFGLDSINSIRLVPMFSERFGIELPVTKLLDGMSVIDIENAITAKWSEIVQHKGSGSEAEKPSRVRKDSYPLSSVQLAVYYDAIKSEGECLYNIPMCYAFGSQVDPERLQGAVRKVIEAHPYLNTHLMLEKGELLQVRNDEAEADVAVLRMSEEEFKVYKAGFIRPFDLQRGPLYRVAVVSTPKAVYLIQDMHHLVFDGLSSGIFLRETAAAYKGVEIEPEGYTYFDYVEDEKELRDSEDYTGSEKYFEEAFKSFEEATEIPPDKSGAAEEGFIGETEKLLPKAEIDTFCKKQGVTASALFLAAVFYTASRFAANKKVALSTISSGRDGLKNIRSLGMFVHTIPLIMDLDRDLQVDGLIKEANDCMRNGIKHEAYPFAELAAKYSYHTELMYEYQVGVTGTDVGEELKYERIPLKLEVPKFKTTVVIGEKEDSYSVLVRYNDALYTAEYMETLAGAVCTVTLSFLADEKADVRRISMLNGEEKELLRGFSCVKSCEPACNLLHKAFEAAALKFPDREALITAEGSWTFKKLNETANIIAGNLTARGLKIRDSIVLLLPRRRFYFAALFGALKAGATFIPCDPEYPSERISHILGDADAKYILTTADHAGDYSGDKVLLIDDMMAGEQTENPEASVSPEDLAYMIYTSGSTGKPKGVELTHRGICNYINPDKDSIFFDYVSDRLERIVSVTTVSFDMSFKDTVGILCNGKTVVFTNEEEMNDPRALAKAMVKTGADAFSATPSRLLQYMEYEPFKEALSKCALVICGGEAYPKVLQERLLSLGIPTLMNSYGPTEITVSSNMADLSRAEHISVGRPLPNYIEYIVDSDGNPVPHGVMGELLIGGPGVARGYRKLPEMTNKNFGEYEGLRVYHTGDYAKWDRDGNVMILGRKDSQVKLRGLRIELGEIEGLIAAQSDISKAVVIIKKLNGQDNLCAYFTASRKIDIQELKEELGKKLTRYMVPTAYLQLDTIPVTPNGKTDLHALPEPVAVSREEYVAPAGEIEEGFADIFARVLKLEKVGATDDFFEIGGTSLVASSVVIEAERSGYSITFGDLFKYKTPRALAAYLKGDISPAEGNEGKAFEEYDHAAIAEILNKNTLEAFTAKGSRPIGNILLTGATGYMGVHVLANFLNLEKGIAYCMVRSKHGRTATQRLKSTLYYYFGDKLTEFPEETRSQLRSRIRVIDGDVTDPEALESLKGEPIDTVFNCAANVKHFSGGTDIEDVNVGGAVNCVKFCLATGARLIHFSTISVAGNVKNTPENAFLNLNEKNMYFGQSLDNQYTLSKMKAELEVMNAVAKEGLDAKVIRVGTLAARLRDGEFQMNYRTNSFVERLRSCVILKAFPYSALDRPIRMGPIDFSARAFLKLAVTPKENCLFNAVNNAVLPYISIIHMMKELGLEIEFVEDGEFERRVAEAEKDPDKAAILQSMSAYESLHNDRSMRGVGVDYELTTQILARQGFFWPPVDRKYFKKFIQGLIGLGFFDSRYLKR
ncbi:MAG: amino acid adenylation domain-containing protein [Lachnospiraceae bacterium]|nr:amino acid adenylation domain-containing protein [Lachnospiraceae bacterium]